MRKLGRERLKWVFLSLISLVIYSGLNIFVAFSFKDILDLVQEGDFALFTSSLIKSCLIIFLMALGFFAKSFVQRRFLSFEIGAYSQDLYSRILRSGQEIENSGKTISLLTNDLSLAITARLNMVFSLVENGILLVFALVTLFVLDMRVAGTVLAFSLILSRLPEIFSRGLSQKRKIQTEEVARMNSQFSNSLAGLETIKSFSMEDLIGKDCWTLVGRAEDATYISKRLIQIANNSLYGFSFMSQVLVILLASVLVLRGYLTIGVILLIGQLMNFVTEPISSLLNAKNELNANKEVLDNLRNIASQARSYGRLEKEGLEEVIEIKDLDFSYGDKVIFEGLTLRLEKGKKYALVGKSGSGKSSLFKLLKGELRPDGGEILIDGIDLRDLNRASIDRIFQKVNQNVFIFARSILFNVCLYDHYSDQAYQEALKRANIFDRVDSLPDKGQTVFSESNDSLSGGEKQRLQLARAFLRDRDVYLFDEVTSNLDLENALLIEKSIGDLDKTVISIRHKLDESLKNYDQIIVLENSRARLIGYDELLKKIE